MRMKGKPGKTKKANLHQMVPELAAALAEKARPLSLREQWAKAERDKRLADRRDRDRNEIMPSKRPPGYGRTKPNAWTW